MNAHVKTAQRFTGRFNVKFRVQSRMARLHHLDAQYVATPYQYLEQFVVLNWNETIIVCMDDKAVVPVGDPGMPLSTSVRPHKSTRSNRRPWTCGNGPWLLHQWSCPHIFKIPSVPLFAQWNYKKKFPPVPCLQNQRCKDYIFFISLKKKAPTRMSFENFKSKDLTINLVSPKNWWKKPVQ